MAQQFQGIVDVVTGSNVSTIRLNPDRGEVRAGGNGVNGDILVFPSGANPGSMREATIHLAGSTGDIRLSAADCAEDFTVLEPERVQPGMVLVLGQEGALQPCDTPYNKRVAGVVSGAGDYRPGIILDRQGTAPDRLAVALMGKVYCHADAGYAPIAIGDLLTTSPTFGHAMKADDPGRAFGAVIGKALRGLDGGRGLIPILVALQ